MKKTIQIIAIIIATVILIALFLPFMLRGKMDNMIRTEGKKLLNAQFDFERLDISIFRNFPMVSLTMENFWVKGVDEFSNDTLMQASGLTTAVNVFSLLVKGGIELTNVELENSLIKALVLPNGNATCNII